jgi:signal transduction histidine kinase
MNKEEALTSLSSGSPHERLRAARFFAKNCDAADAPILREVRLRESNTYVKTILDGVISRLSNGTAIENTEAADDEDIPKDVIRKARTQAVESITALLLHEVASPFGLVENAAAREIGNYANSDTKKFIDRVQRILEGIEQLKNATSRPNPQTFDLAEFIDIIIAEESHSNAIKPAQQGPRPFLVTTDPVLLRFAVCNGLRNAIEAAGNSKAEQPVVVTWGSNDTDYWVTIIDDGPGLAGSPESAFEPGKSSKKAQGHIGFGLSIAKQAIESLDGFVTLSPGRTGGARYELKWSR